VRFGFSQAPRHRCRRFLRQRRLVDVGHVDRAGQPQIAQKVLAALAGGGKDQGNWLRHSDLYT
jgi:hypothetical protein